MHSYAGIISCIMLNMREHVSCNLLHVREQSCFMHYRKIPIISPGLIVVQKAFLLGLFLGELIFGGAYYWREFCISKWVWFVKRNNNSNSPWAYIREGLLLEGYLCLRFGGLIFGRAYFWGGLLSEFYGMLNMGEYVSCALAC